jgi:hypothetical protein
MLAFGAHVTFEPVDGTDFGGVMDSRPALAYVSLQWGKKGTKSTKPVLASQTLLEDSLLKYRVGFNRGTAQFSVTTVYLTCMQKS